MYVTSTMDRNICDRHICQLGPRYEGQLTRMAEPILLPVNPPRTHSRLYHHPVDGPTGGSGHEWLNDADAGCVLFQCRLRRRECCMLWAPYSQPTVPPHELLPARLVSHRQTSAYEGRKGTRDVQLRSGILADFCYRHHWLWITVELHIPARTTRRLMLGREVATLPVHRVSGSKPLCLRTHTSRPE